jgi:hypothetical protein
VPYVRTVKTASAPTAVPGPAPSPPLIRSPTTSGQPSTQSTAGQLRTNLSQVRSYSVGRLTPMADKHRPATTTFGASDMPVPHQMGHSKVGTTKNIYAHLFAWGESSHPRRDEPGGQPPLRVGCRDARIICTAF